MFKKNILLAIETSCDETSVAIIKNWTEILSLETATSIALHQKTRWVIPEIAARAQLEYINSVLNKALKIAKIKMEDIDWIAVTQWPWLIWSLLIWISTANVLGAIYKKPIYWVNHIHWHIFSNFLERNIDEIKFPSVVLTVSWWHNEIYLLTAINYQLKLLWETLDDSAWEAFDKCWRLLWLPYPAWSAVAKLAEKWDKKAFDFPRWMQRSWDFNFSFSWLKTSFLYTLEKLANNKLNKEQTTNNHKLLITNKKLTYDLAASLQESICDILSEKIISAAKKYKAKQIHLSWWVSANLRLRELVKEKFWWEIIYPKKLIYCTDNAAMIWAAWYFQNIKAKKAIEAKLW